MVPQGQKLLGLLIFAVFPGTILGIQFCCIINDQFNTGFKYLVKISKSNFLNHRIEMLAIHPDCQLCDGICGV